VCPRSVKQDKRYSYLGCIVRPQLMYALAFKVHWLGSWIKFTHTARSIPVGTFPTPPESSKTAGKYAGHRHGCISCSPFASGSGRNHSETCVGCIVSLTTPTKSSLKASRSVSSRILAEKASRVFLASYFLL
jgi:hypothetical protein